VGKGTNKLRGVREKMPDWGREESIQCICVDRQRYSSLISELNNSNQKKREYSAYTLCSMTKIDIDDHAKIIEQWNNTFSMYNDSTDSTIKNNTLIMLGYLGAILAKMNTEKAKRVLDGCSGELKNLILFNSR
jgi:hypothetical protein